MNKKKGFTITEIVIAAAVFLSIFAALMLLNKSSRTDTSKSINYLRAMELAQEAIDFINSTPFSEATKDNFDFLSGLVSKVQLGQNGGARTEYSYPEDYAKCYYYRDITIDDISSIPNNKYLKKISVEVSWNEGKVPNQIEAIGGGKPDRMRRVVLSTVLFNDKESY